MCWKGRRLSVILVMFLLFQKRLPFGRVKKSHFFKLLMNQGLKMCLRCMGNRAAPAQPMYDTLWEEKKTWYLIVIFFLLFFYLLYNCPLDLAGEGLFNALFWLLFFYNSLKENKQIWMDGVLRHGVNFCKTNPKK